MATAAQGTVYTYKEAFTDVIDDVRMHGQFYTYTNEYGLVSGCTMSIMLTVDKPKSDVWPYFKDFNLWQNQYDHYYSGVVGDLEGKTFRLSLKPNDDGPHQYRVIRVIPEYLIVFDQPIPGDGTGGTGLPGLGRVSPGTMSFGLDEYEGITHVAIFMEHGTLMAEAGTPMTEEEAIAPWRDILVDAEMKWRDIFVPTFKKLVYQAS